MEGSDDQALRLCRHKRFKLMILYDKLIVQTFTDLSGLFFDRFRFTLAILLYLFKEPFVAASGNFIVEIF